MDREMKVDPTRCTQLARTCKKALEEIRMEDEIPMEMRSMIRGHEPNRRRYSGGAIYAVLAGALCAMLSVLPVAAEPSGGILERADATVRLEVKNKTLYVLDISVERITGTGGATMAVSLQKCDGSGDCKPPIKYAKEVSEAEFEMSPDGTTATLSSIFAGLLLEVNWSSTSYTPGVYASPREVQAGRRDQATAHVQAIGASCEALGNLQLAMLVAVDRQAQIADREWPDRLPRPLRKGVPKCAG